MDNSSQKSFKFENLPKDVQVEIIKCLPYQDVASFRQISKEKLALIDNNPSVYLENLTMSAVADISRKVGKGAHESVIRAFFNYATTEKCPDNGKRMQLLQVVAQYGNTDQLQTILNQRVGPESFPDSFHRVSVLQIIAKHGSNELRKLILDNHATKKLLPLSHDRIALLQTIAKYGSNALRKLILDNHATKELLPHQWERMSILPLIAQYGDNELKNSVRALATPENFPDPLNIQNLQQAASFSAFSR